MVNSRDENQRRIRSYLLKDIMVRAPSKDNRDLSKCKFPNTGPQHPIPKVEPEEVQITQGRTHDIED